MVDDYLDAVVRKGDAGSDLLAGICSETLKNVPYVVRARGQPALCIPDDFDVVVFQGVGNASLEGAVHAHSLVENLVLRAKRLGALPVGLANVIDSRDGDLHRLEEIARGLRVAANRYSVAVLNGENAILGDRVRSANMVGTMIGMLEKGRRAYGLHKVKGTGGFSYFVFAHEGRNVFINSDGVGTKVEFYERLGDATGALYDSLAMKLDDAARVFGDVRCVFDVVETRGRIPMHPLRSLGRELGFSLGIPYVLEEHKVADRISGYNKEPAFHISGSCVSLLPDSADGLQPMKDDCVVAISAGPNPRSNGISDKRRILQEVYGADWHLDRRASALFSYVTAPSVILYPLFMDLLGSGLASSVHHMSGGALQGKLARPFARQGLFARLDGLFHPPKEELFLQRNSGGSLRDWYAKCPMGNDAYVTTRDPERTIGRVQHYGFRAKQVGVLEQAHDGRTGVEVHLRDGAVMYFTGK